MPDSVKWLVVDSVVRAQTMGEGRGISDADEAMENVVVIVKRQGGNCRPSAFHLKPPKQAGLFVGA